MSAKSMAADEARWRAESDARTIAEAEAIKLDPTRLTAAKTQLQKTAKAANAAVAAVVKPKPTPSRPAPSSGKKK